MKFRVLTLFPDMFKGFIETSIIGRAIQNQYIEVDCTNIRDYTLDKHQKVDDSPFGGGSGMVMQVEPLKRALLSQPQKGHSHVIYLSPRGGTLTHDKVVELAQYEELVLVCGHYEGIDQRFIDTYVDEELSIGDYVLTGGELASMVLMDSVSRMVPGVLSNAESGVDESFASGLLEYPHYTRPQVYDEKEVPPVLLSGNHAEIDKWRLEQSLLLTKAKRPDLFKAYIQKEHPKSIQKIIKKCL